MQAKTLLLADEWKNLVRLICQREYIVLHPMLIIMADCMALCSAVTGQFSYDTQEWRPNFWAKLNIELFEFNIVCNNINEISIMNNYTMYYITSTTNIITGRTFMDHSIILLPAIELLPVTSLHDSLH